MDMLLKCSFSRGVTDHNESWQRPNGHVRHKNEACPCWQRELRKVLIKYCYFGKGAFCVYHLAFMNPLSKNELLKSYIRRM